MMWEQVYNYVIHLQSYNPISMIAELLVVGFVVYSVMGFLQGTGGEKLFKGIVFILLGCWAISLLARATGLDLDRINWLFKNFLLWAMLIVAAIAFQPELRRGLMKLGGTRFGHTPAPELQRVIEHVVDSASILSKKQIGGLIAFERQVGLGDLINTGNSLEAQVTAELLNTIFWPGSPLHDMAVIIRNGRVAAAGVQLPLAEHGEYDRRLGSRHRAAIGLSKESDAVVVVISEETGQIALAVGGKLTRFLTLEQLRQQLLDLLLPMVAEKHLSKKELALPQVGVKSPPPSGETPGDGQGPSKEPGPSEKDRP